MSGEVRHERWLVDVSGRITVQDVWQFGRLPPACPDTVTYQGTVYEFVEVADGVQMYEERLDRGEEKE